MSNINKIEVDNTQYDIEDTTARNSIDTLMTQGLIGTISNVYWWERSWTAPSDGMMVLRIIPSANDWYWYINDTSINATTGSWAHQFRGTLLGAVTYCIPVKKGATYSSVSMRNIDSIQCFFYPMGVGGGTA